MAELCRRVDLSGRDWHFLKADRADAYQQLPLARQHSDMAVAALKCQADGKWYGLFRRTLLFGAVDAVLHYNVFSRVLSELFTQLFGVPMLSFFGDFGALAPAEIAPLAPQTFTSFCETLGD